VNRVGIKKAALLYIEHEWRVLPLKGKVPWNIDTDKPLEKWSDPETFHVTAANFDDHFNGVTTGIGVITDQIADIDLDSPTARYLAPRIMPKTASFGRPSANISHLVYSCTGDEFQDIQLPGDGHHIELRANSGHQTMFPGSIHPDNELVEWRNECDPTAISIGELKQHVNVLAIACIFSHFYEEGNRDNLITILAHVLHKHLSLPAEDIQVIADAIMDFHDDTDAARKHKADKTVKFLLAGKPKPGLPKLKEIIGKEWTDRISESLGHTEQDEWQEPVNIFADSAPVKLEPLPRDFLPGAFGHLADSIAEVTQCPYEIPFMGIVASTLSTMGSNVEFRIKQNDPWTVPSLIWGLAICPSGTRKSSGLDASLKPYYQVQSILLKEYIAGKQIHAQIVDGWDEEGPPPEMFPEPVLITNKSTSEQLAVDMVSNSPLAHLDEADSLVRGMNQYKNGKGDDRSLYMKAWNGTMPHSVRLRSGTLHIPKTYISIAGLTQPAVAREFLRSELGFESGWAARHGLLFWPDDIERTASDRSAHHNARSRVRLHLLALRKVYQDIEATPQATDAFMKFEAKNIAEVAKLDDPFRGHWDKFNSYVVQLAGFRTMAKLTLKTDKNDEFITKQDEFPFLGDEPSAGSHKDWEDSAVEYPQLQLIPCSYGADSLPMIDVDDVEFAVDIVERCLKEHARKVYVSMTDDPGAEIARKLHPWFVELVAEGKDRVTRSLILRRYKLKDNAKKYEAVIRYLVRCQIIRPLKGGFDRNPELADVFRINPKVVPDA